MMLRYSSTLVNSVYGCCIQVAAGYWPKMFMEVLMGRGKCSSYSQGRSHGKKPREPPPPPSLIERFSKDDTTPLTTPKRGKNVSKCCEQIWRWAITAFYVALTSRLFAKPP